MNDLDFTNTLGLRIAALYLLSMTKGQQPSLIRKRMAAEIQAYLERLDAISTSGLAGTQDLPEIKALAVCRAWTNGDWAKAAASYAKDHYSTLFSRFGRMLTTNSAEVLPPYGAARLALALSAAGIEIPDKPQTAGHTPPATKSRFGPLS
jgi:hypothetical protein